jgi:hypothetical protein
MSSDCYGTTLVGKTVDWKKWKEEEAKERKTRKENYKKCVIITQLLLLFFMIIEVNCNKIITGYFALNQEAETEGGLLAVGQEHGLP